MAGQLYFAVLFYPTLAEAVKQVTAVKDEITQMSKGDYKVLAYGGNTCCIGFVTETPRSQIRERLQRIHGEKFHQLVVPASEGLFGYMSTDSWDWVSARIPRGPQNPALKK